MQPRTSASKFGTQGSCTRPLHNLGSAAGPGAPDRRAGLVPLRRHSRRVDQEDRLRPTGYVSLAQVHTDFLQIRYLSKSLRAIDDFYRIPGNYVSGYSLYFEKAETKFPRLRVYVCVEQIESIAKSSVKDVLSSSDTMCLIPIK